MPDAKVACRQLGFTKAVGPSDWGRGTGKIWLDEMRLCHAYRYLIVNTASYEVPKPVCQSSWDMPEAKVACRQLGFTKTVGPSWNGRGTGKVWLERMGCLGSEASLGSCSHNGWGNAYYGCNNHNEDAGVVCICSLSAVSAAPSTFNLGEGATIAIQGNSFLVLFEEVYHQGQWGTVCQYGWSMNDAKVACRQLGFTKTVGPSGYGRGTEVYHQSQWGTVCVGSWGTNNAKVACRQLGFTKTVGASYNGRGTGKVWLYGMGCSGSEASLGSCSHNGWRNVYSWRNNHKDDAGVVCICSCMDHDIKQFFLEDVSNVQTRKEVYHQRQWGTVCHYGWDMPDAKVACRQLGFTKTVGHSYWGRGTGKIWLDEMRCTGSESSLGSCNHNGWGNVDPTHCNGHTRDAGVV
ncbi:deleted in malignant brain tumors 1 protein-like [Actinia tenebrosa]|uniref:Deleted in malignant brain tumors 1 protein-like n=1 Tax=Actinia tenebrosa TaxID=6105 RepID=A0A6P8J3F6_ACTTE|nr:deleted in malignant brain tumors 1 protein-like [Actinia tenebrosa]